ncbi:MAG TPA: hypothetical protein VN823_17260 [Stellaceae bacterium]|nr:hypothetical protein [Stellaceae bacterium]
MEQDNNPVVTWSLALDGGRADLEEWRVAFAEQPQARVDVEQAGSPRAQYCLRSSHFDALTDANEVREIGAQLVARMYGAMRLQGKAGPVSLGATVYAHRPGGQRDAYTVPAPAALGGRSGPIEVLAAGQPRPRSEAEQTVELAEADDSVADAVEHFARSDGWFDVYKTLEVIEGDLCRREASRNGRQVIARREWATRKELADLGSSIDFHRHHGKPRPDPLLALDAAQDLVRHLLREWLREKRNARKS